MSGRFAIFIALPKLIPCSLILSHAGTRFYHPDSSSKSSTCLPRSACIALSAAALAVSAMLAGWHANTPTWPPTAPVPGCDFTIPQNTCFNIGAALCIWHPHPCRSRDICSRAFQFAFVACGTLLGQNTQVLTTNLRRMAASPLLSR